jgi:transcriptional regulator with XRE-family HTH domain
MVMTTGERIRNRRKELRLTADILAGKLGVSRSTIFRYENGSIEKLPINHLYKIASMLNTTVEYLTGYPYKNNAHNKNEQAISSPFEVEVRQLAMDLALQAKTDYPDSPEDQFRSVIEKLSAAKKLFEVSAAIKKT